MERKVATTLREILHNPVVEASLDRSKSIKPVIEETLKAWQADLDKRRPAPAYKESAEGEAIYNGTDFDLFTLLMALSQRRAVINIPAYERLQPRMLRLNQRVISPENRHGQIYKVISNADVHSFSVRIKDFNVLEILSDEREEVGAFRHFSLVDQNGRWNDGWSRIEFRASPKEKRFFDEHKLMTYEEPMKFRHFVHPNLAMAFYGSRYIATKALTSRIKDQADHYRRFASQLRKRGVRLGSAPEEQLVTYEKFDGKAGIRTQVQNIQTRLVLPEFTGTYPIYSLNENWKATRWNNLPANDYKAMQGVLRYAEWIAKYLTYGIGAAVRAPVRAVELAYFLHGFEMGRRELGYEKPPGWGIPPWVREYVDDANPKTVWNALQLAEDGSALLLYRMRHTTVRAVRETVPVVEDPQALTI